MKLGTHPSRNEEGRASPQFSYGFSLGLFVLAKSRFDLVLASSDVELLEYGNFQLNRFHLERWELGKQQNNNTLYCIRVCVCGFAFMGVVSSRSLTLSLYTYLYSTCADMPVLPLRQLLGHNIITLENPTNLEPEMIERDLSCVCFWGLVGLPGLWGGGRGWGVLGSSLGGRAVSPCALELDFQGNT